MVEITFKGVSPAYSAKLGPASHFRLHGPDIHDGDTGELVAEHRNLGWDVQGQHYLRFDCSVPVAIRFEDPSGGKVKPLDPAAQAWAVDGYFYADGEPFAKVHEEVGVWQELDSDDPWPVIVLAPAPR